ncbi:hypothetical protein [Ornithinicoccus hortensis]|uniref:DUF2613 family protein n=1 Tax=Ornithinicoccus hortensis TaxID=82346 RepID=A0A542YN82_9MICO|nr:hypothetical protein [Ornithinicoccus hortensis]TQL49499.1 hypothetical protein FB467_0572 [Ornithinicoccus hortensis]
MSQNTSAVAGRRALPAVLAVVVGLGAAGAAAAAVVSSYAPDDSAARETGPADIQPAQEILGYGD